MSGASSGCELKSWVDISFMARFLGSKGQRVPINRGPGVLRKG